MMLLRNCRNYLGLDDLLPTFIFFQEVLILALLLPLLVPGGLRTLFPFTTLNIFVFVL